MKGRRRRFRVGKVYLNVVLNVGTTGRERCQRGHWV